MSEYLHVEKPFLDQLASLGWTIIDQGHGLIQSNPADSLRSTFRECLLPEIFRQAVRAINRTADGQSWLTDRQLDDLRDQIVRQPTRTLLEANEAVHALLFKAQVDVNESTGEADPVVQLIDFVHPERNVFHAINQFRIDTPGCVKGCIIPDIVLFVNGIPLVVVEAKIGDQNTANPLHAAFEQLLRYRNGRSETIAAGLREGEPRLFYPNLFLIRTCGEKAEFGTITSGHEHFYAWKDIWPDSPKTCKIPLGVEREQEWMIQGLTGTPLMTEQHGTKRTVKRFGDYIDTYKLMDAVRDGATLQILYEGRTADTALKDKHGFDTKFEDLFKERTEAELSAIKKKYGASGDLLEAEKRIEAIARDLVNHYIDNILPDGFKAQVVCHSKLAAVRYQKAIRAALSERLARERLQPKPDEDLIRRIAFLKAVVVLSADATNELAVITEARREAKRWNAVENFCKPFDFDDPANELTGIAFLIVCDMLLTGFDAPVEQVMYIDKRLKEHNLLQAIARVNRVATGKARGFIVDYIGLANHLTDALRIYAQEDVQDLQQGLKNLLTELPILEERYQRLLQHFRSAGVMGMEAFVNGAAATPEAEVAVVHAAVGAMKDIKLRADFEVYPQEVSPKSESDSSARGGPSLSWTGQAFRVSPADGERALQGRFIGSL